MNITETSSAFSSRKLLSLANSSSLWEMRMSIISTYRFIRNNQYDDTQKIYRTLLHDDQALIHEAVGWMLREVGNRDRKTEDQFLLEHYKLKPRTMLGYENRPDAPYKVF